jgi:hypothetical protein
MPKRILIRLADHIQEIDSLFFKRERKTMSEWDWKLHPKAEVFLEEKISLFKKRNEFALRLSNMIEQKTNMKLLECIDHMAFPEAEVTFEYLTRLGFRPSNESNGDYLVFRVFGSSFFPVLLKKGKDTELALNAEHIEKLNSNVHKNIEGQPNAPFRKLDLNQTDTFLISAIERHGISSYAIDEANDIDHYVKAFQTLSSRSRQFDSEEEGIKETQKIIQDLSLKLDKPRLADAFFRAERDYWQNRNQAAKVQKSRQDEFGLGWSNHDHHTFRSSRRNFSALLNLFKLLGLIPRERFYAGAQAGWGAQILEDPNGRNVVFADVDLASEEHDLDFTQSLEPMKNLGTVGLWVELHGESILQAGMHHLAARFKFDDVRADLQRSGVAMMKPFSNFPFLKQAFTEPQIWQVTNETATHLLKTGRINSEQASKFAAEGAVGSHLENIQRGQGFKGFNQSSVSAIIKLVDPRAQAERSA